MRPLAGAYAFDYPSIAAFYAGDPRSPDAWRHAYSQRQQRQPERAELARRLGDQQVRRAAPPAARESAARLADARSAAIVTGQQAGLFGGPLFTLLKAVTAMQLARRAEATLEAPVVPVFWVDAEDHDWNEIASCTVLDAELQPRVITLPSPTGAGDVPIASLALDDRIGEHISALEASLARTDFTDWLIAGLRAAYAPGTGTADAFARWLEALLGPHGLVVCDSSDPALKPLVTGVFSRELSSPGQTAALASDAGARLAASGHEPQVVPQADAVAVLHLDGSRRPIRRQGDDLLVGERSCAPQQLAEEARTDPQRFSPNVLLRPIVQDTLFPTVCYVAGPSELAYFGQLRPVYEHFDVPMPLVHPRASATLVDSATLRFLARYDVALEDLQPQDEAALNRLLAAQLPPVVDATIREAADAIQQAMARVIDIIPTVEPTLAGAARTTLGKVEHEVRTLQGKVIQAAKKRDETLRRQFRRAQAQTFPLGKPQERVVSVDFFLNLYGPALVTRLLDELPIEAGQHWVVSV